MPEEITIEQLTEAIREVVTEEVKKGYDAELKKLANTPRSDEGDLRYAVGEGPGNAVRDTDLSFLDEKDEIPKGPSGFRGLLDFTRTVAFNKGDSRLIPASKALEEGDPESAGILVPVEYQTVMLTLAIERSKILKGCSMTSMKHQEVKVPVCASLDESSGLIYGGIDFVWVDEGKTKSEKEFKLQRVTLRSNTSACLVKVTNQLLEDSSPRAESVIRELYSDAFKNFADNMILNGNGAGQVQGILKANCLYTQSKESGQTAATIVYENIKKMYSRMYPDGKDSCIWLINDEGFEQIMDMHIPVGTGGSAVMLASGEGVKSPPKTLLGRPIVWTGHCKSLGTKGDIYLADLKNFLVGFRKKFTIDVSIHVYFTTNHTLFRFEARWDGQPIIPSTMKTRSNFEVSPFVTLQARA